VAGLATRAVRDGDDWILNGQKVWTTVAHISRWGMLLARTDPDAPKHDGLSYFVLDMQAPGVEVRPLYQITAEAEFNEVFMNDVRIPHDRMLGKEGQGWRVAITTLMNERVAIGGGGSKKKGGGAIAQLLKLWQERKPGSLSTAQEALLRDRVTQLWIDSELLRVTAQRARATQQSGNPGPEGSVSKLAQAEINKRLWETALDVLGNDGLSFEAGYELRQGYGGTDTVESLAKYQFLRSRANSIEGGTSEIMRNILGERVLGLPGEPRVDKKVPWKDVPRS
jgi:alkylation response protein AidB-like acyl-CoA dehydrogenase